MTLSVLASMARIRTAHAGRYLRQLCEHWQQRFVVEMAGERGLVRIPRDARGCDWPGEAFVMLLAGVVDLEVRIQASCQDQLDAIKVAVARHLSRFAPGEELPAIEWRALDHAISAAI